jgi:TPR repeat protein
MGDLRIMGNVLETGRQALGCIGMRKVFGIAIVVAALGAGMPAQAQMGSAGSRGYDDYSGGMRSEHPDPRANSHADYRVDPETYAEEMRKRGKCEDAVPVFRKLADNGSGYEISQYNLGLCLLDLAAANPEQSDEQRKEAAEYILEAANAGFGKAQAAAVGLYLDGTGVDVDPVEAGKWALVYHDNGMRLALGLPDLPKDVQTRLDTALAGSKRSEARARANAWTPSAESVDR